jgi:hypothetical protein
MALNLFAGKSQSWLEAELAKAQADLSAGKTVTSVTSDGSSTGKLVQVSAVERIKLLLAALNKIAPDSYPWKDAVSTSRTRAVFS